MSYTPASKYVDVTGDTMTGPLTTAFVTSTGGLQITRPVNSSANLEFSSADKLRWTMGKGPGTESGSNAGAEFNVSAWTDAGAWLNTPLSINRATGLVTLLKGADVSNNRILNVSNPVNDSDAANKGWVNTYTWGVLSGVDGWGDFGSGAAGMYVSKSGGRVVVEASLKRSADKTLTAGTPVQIAQVPAGYYPTHDVNFSGGITVAGDLVNARFRITQSGQLQLIPMVSGILSANGIAFVNASYIGA